MRMVFNTVLTTVITFLLIKISTFLLNCFPNRIAIMKTVWEIRFEKFDEYLSQRRMRKLERKLDTDEYLRVSKAMKTAKKEGEL